VTHDAGHALLEAAAAAILVVGGAACFILAWRARHPGGSVTLLPEPPDSVARAVRVLAAVLSLGAAVIHFAATPVHLEELGIAGLGFVAAGTFQAAWTLAWLIEASRVVGRIGIAGNLGIMAIWGWSRTIGLPVGAVTIPEPIGAPDAAATVFQVLLIGLVLSRTHGVAMRLPARVPDASAAATTVLIPAIGLVFLATTLAVTVLADGRGHGHDAGDSHGQPAAAGEAERAAR
jgi:hypothetical protein